MPVLFIVAVVVGLWFAITLFNSISPVNVMFAWGRHEVTPRFYPAIRGPLMIPFWDHWTSLSTNKVAGFGIFLARR